MLTGCDAAVKGEVACARPYLADLGKRAYRRPLTDAEQARPDGLLELSRTRSRTRTGLAMVVQAMLLSPKFLFRAGDSAIPARRRQGVPLTPGRLHAAVVLPDRVDPRRRADGVGRLGRAGERSTRSVEQARRLLTQPRAQNQLVKFHTQWLGTDTISSLAKNETRYPDFSPLLA